MLIIKEERRFYVYKHLRLDTDSVFHVGKGQKRRAWKKRKEQNK